MSNFKTLIEENLLYESMKEVAYAQKDNSYFREFTHDNKSVKDASLSIEKFLSKRNPGSLVNRIDESKFIMIHPGGDLITNVNTYDNKHYVATHYISPEPKDYLVTTTEVNNKRVYEDIRNQIIVRGNMGSSVHFRKKNPETMKNNLLKLQQDFFSGHRPKH